MLQASEPWRTPATYAEAKAWLESRAGFHLVMRDDAEQVLVVVAVHGRSAQVVATSESPKDVETAFLAAVAGVRLKL